VVLVLEGTLRYISTGTIILLTRDTKFVCFRIIALMLGRLRMDIKTAIKHYDKLAEQVFSDIKPWGEDRKIMRAKKLEEVIKSMVGSVTPSRDSESPLLERDQAGACPTYVY